jgi:hypothetical protein
MVQIRGRRQDQMFALQEKFETIDHTGDRRRRLAVSRLQIGNRSGLESTVSVQELD